MVLLLITDKKTASKETTNRENLEQYGREIEKEILDQNESNKEAACKAQYYGAVYYGTDYKRKYHEKEYQKCSQPGFFSMPSTKEIEDCRKNVYEEYLKCLKRSSNENPM